MQAGYCFPADSKTVFYRRRWIWGQLKQAQQNYCSSSLFDQLSIYRRRLMMSNISKRSKIALFGKAFRSKWSKVIMTGRIKVFRWMPVTEGFRDEKCPRSILQTSSKIFIHKWIPRLKVLVFLQRKSKNCDPVYFELVDQQDILNDWWRALDSINRGNWQTLFSRFSSKAENKIGPST